MTDPVTVLVVSFDRWPWPALGCYGHEWIDTPAWDQLAADGFTFDRCVATIDQDRRTHGELWNRFLRSFQQSGYRTTLCRESPAAPLGADTLWDQVHVVTGNTAADAPLAEQSFAKTVQVAIGELQHQSEHSRFVWVHGVGLPERCPVSRAALELYSSDFAEEGLRIASMTDEELVDHELTRATTLSVLDHWLGELLDAARGLSGRKLMTVFAWAGAIWEPAPRPTPLIAPFDPQVAQVPWIIAGDGILPGRANSLITTDDLFSTLGCWAGIRDNPDFSVDLRPLIRGDVADVRSCVQRHDTTGGARWSPDDLTLFARTGNDCSTQRFLWPDDGWAVHDVATQTPEITAKRLADFQADR